MAPNRQKVDKPARRRPLQCRDFLSTPGGTRTPNLLIRSPPGPNSGRKPWPCGEPRASDEVSDAGQHPARVGAKIRLGRKVEPEDLA